MMKTIKFLILPAIFAGVFISCSDNGNDEPPVDSNGYEAPEAPSTVNQANLINIEFYSKLNDETLFSAQYDQAVVSHMELASPFRLWFVVFLYPFFVANGSPR